MVFWIPHACATEDAVDLELYPGHPAAISGSNLLATASSAEGKLYTWFAKMTAIRK